MSAIVGKSEKGSIMKWKRSSEAWNYIPILCRFTKAFWEIMSHLEHKIEKKKYWKTQSNKRLDGSNQHVCRIGK